jgi:hypothetical protein
VQSDDALAERLMKRRATALLMLSIWFIVVQGLFIDTARHSVGSAGTVKIAAWVVMVVVLLLAFATGGGWARSREVRTLMNDESTRIHRARATMIAFYNMMATGVVVYAIDLFKPVTGGQAVHLMMTVGIASALMAFATWERAALRINR